MIAAVNRYHQACSFERGLQLLLDAASDAKGATSALESRARERAIEELLEQRKDLEKQRAGIKGADTESVARRAAIDAAIQTINDKIFGLRVARADKLLADPNAGQTSEKHGSKIEDAPAPPAPPAPPPPPPPPDPDQ